MSKKNQTEKDQAMALLEGMDAKQIPLKIAKIQYLTKPTGGDLDHVLTVTINLNEDERVEVDDLLRHYWEHGCILGGTRKPEQGSFDTEEFGEDIPD